MAADLRKCYSEDDLPTVPWQFYGGREGSAASRQPRQKAEAAIKSRRRQFKNRSGY